MDTYEMFPKGLTNEEKLERILKRCREVLLERPKSPPTAWFDLGSLMERDAHNNRLEGAQSMAEYVFRMCGEEIPYPVVEEIKEQQNVR